MGPNYILNQKTKQMTAEVKLHINLQNKLQMTIGSKLHFEPVN